MYSHSPLPPQLNTGREQIISEYQSRVAGLESQLREVTERCESAEGQIEELKTELQDMEGILSDNREELASITEQLAEVGMVQPVHEGCLCP